MKNFIKSLQFIFRPSFWLMNHSYCPVHDTILNKLMDKHDFTDIGAFTAYLGSVEIWIANYPYSVGIREVSCSSRPSRLTIVRMKKKLRCDTLKKYGCKL